MVYGYSHRSFRPLNGRQLLNFILIKYQYKNTLFWRLPFEGVFFFMLLCRILQTTLEVL